MKVKTLLSLLLVMITFIGENPVHAQTENVNFVRAVEESKLIVEKLLKSAPIIDGHNDLFAWYFGCSYKNLPKCPQDLFDYPLDTIQLGQTDIPRWKMGGVGGVLLNVYADSLKSFLDAYDLLYRLQDTYNNDLKVVVTSSEMSAAIQQGKIAILPMLEGSIRLENKMSFLRIFYKLGLRCVTFTYNTSDLADGSDDVPIHNGISVLGQEMVREMNELGIIIDMSHISANAMSQILDITNAPVIFSHSNAKALCNVSRNVPDSILFRLKSNGGIIMLDMVPEHTTNQFTKWVSTGDSIYFVTKQNYPNDLDVLRKVMTQWERENPKPIVTIANIADHFDYVKELIGVDYIGIGGDYDGLDYTINGLEDVSCFPNLLVELTRRGWTETELEKITSKNFLRVFEAVENKSN